MLKARAKYHLGQVVRHRKHPFRGVVFDVDPEFANTEEWYHAIPEDSRPPAESPCEEAEGEDCTDDAGAEIRGRSDTSTPPASPEPERAATPAERDPRGDAPGRN